jgi:hypothetical protein
MSSLLRVPRDVAKNGWRGGAIQWRQRDSRSASTSIPSTATTPRVSQPYPHQKAPSSGPDAPVRESDLDDVAVGVPNVRVVHTRRVLALLDECPAGGLDNGDGVVESVPVYDGDAKVFVAATVADPVIAVHEVQRERVVCAWRVQEHEIVPADLWPDEAPTGPGPYGGLHGSAPWFLAYHALVCLDYDLTGEFEPWEPPQPFDENTFSSPNRMFTKPELLAYVDWCRGRVRQTLDALTEEMAARPLPGTHRYHGTLFGVLVGSVPLHVVEHAAQIRQFLTAAGVNVQPMPGDHGYTSDP